MNPYPNSKPQGTPAVAAPIEPAQLQFIEQTFGDYLGEDDIVRLEDTYGRAAR